MKKRILLILCVAAVVGAALMLVRYNTESAPLWRAAIRVFGGEWAYEVMMVSVSGKSIRDEHNTAHRFGEALYGLEGVPGIAVCDDRLFYGCMHQMVAQAVAEFGLASVEQIASVAQRAPDRALPHSIGHGVLGSIGYTEDALSEALFIGCRSFRYDPREACASGVFMEYSFWTMLQPDGGIRPLEGNLHAPCATLRGMNRPEMLWCLYWLPNWWDLHEDDTAVFGERCRAYEGDERDACFMGIGKGTAWLPNQSAEATRAGCEAATDDATLRTSCFASAAYEFASAGFPEEAERICGFLEGEHAIRCEQYARAELLPPKI